ncbi:Inactive pancreatic lipase-related protein 1 [Frankliniella fusca]|uniref:Inactive pancreatic lipase-related protein 1 n=1 Tax=Frankliniella fusca TaxID=407009 RepID=A0AAE1H480_9NEOP|nr:Inactive pancreatic lipase-related protein 1 [Frankliniella fusca]
MTLLGVTSLLLAVLVLAGVQQLSAQGLRRGGGGLRFRRPALRRALNRAAQEQQLQPYQPPPPQQQQLRTIHANFSHLIPAERFFHVQLQQPPQQQQQPQLQQRPQFQQQPQLQQRTQFQQQPQLQQQQPPQLQQQQQQSPPRGSSSITFYVFTRYYAQPGVLQVGDDASLQASGFNSRRPTKVLVHGFGSNVNRTMMTTIKDAYLYAMDVNVVSVDWSPLSAVPWYPAARYNVDVVGARLAALLDWLATRGALPDQVHVVGHSLGAHVAAVAGANLRSGKLSRISGLDPARPGFRDVEDQRRLDPSDAILVDVIHTTAGFLGLEQPIGHVDFYPNGGTMSQPGCITDIAGICSHEKAFKIFRDSISDVDFPAVGCDSARDAMQGRCSGRRGVMGERGDAT